MFRDTFYGQKISDYGRTYGRVDYHALVSSFDAVLCNSILGYRDSFDDWEQTNGFVDNSEAIEEKREALEALETESEELTEEKATIETTLEDAEEAETNTADLLERFESFEYEANEMIEKLKWYNYEVEGVGDIDSDSIEREIDSIDFWSLRSDIEGHLDEVTEHREALEERLAEIEEELEEINGKRDELEAEIEELEEEDTTETEVFQWYIISDSGAQILEENTNEILYYNAELDLYLWGVTHWGTSWDYVLTSIPCETYEETEARERAEAEAEAKAEAKTDEDGLEEVEELLDLWDVDEEELEEVEELEEEADPLDSENGNTLEAWIESLSKEHLEEVAELKQLDWEVATVGDIVIGKPSATVVYGITTEGWKGKITEIRPSFGEDEEDPHSFDFVAVGFDNEPNEFGVDANTSFTLNSVYFDVFTDEEA